MRLASCLFMTGLLLSFAGRAQPRMTHLPPSTRTCALPLTSPTPPEHISTSRYQIDIVYPLVPVRETSLVQSLEQIAGAAKRDFMQSLPDPKQFPNSPTGNCNC